MIYEAALLLDTGMTSTLSASSTDYIDTLAAGNDYKGCIFVCHQTVAATASGAPTVQFLLQTASTSSFVNGDTVTLAISATFSVAALALGNEWHCVIPSGAKRYIRGRKIVASTGTVFFTAGTTKMFIAEDIDVNIDRRRLMVNTV